MKWRIFLIISLFFLSFNSGTPRRTTDDSDTTQIPHSSGAEDVGEDHPKNGRVPTVGPQKDEGEDDEASVIVQLALRVQDGTRCRIDSLDMCIQGKCQASGVVSESHLGERNLLLTNFFQEIIPRSFAVGGKFWVQTLSIHEKSSIYKICTSGELRHFRYPFAIQII